MQWEDIGYLLAKNTYNENSIIIEAFTLDHGKCTGIVYGGASRKQKKNFQIGNNMYINWRSKGENRSGYFYIELIKPITPLFFDDKKKTVCIQSACSILKILLPERQVNKKIYNSFQNMLDSLNKKDWILEYIEWELFLIKELGFGVNIFNLKDSNELLKKNIIINDKSFTIPKILFNKMNKEISNIDIIEALNFNKNLLIENFINPNRLKFPLFRNILTKYYN